MRHVLAALLAVLLGAWPTLALAGTYYVDSANASCSDAGAGTEAAPFCTLHRVTDGITTREVGGSGGPYVGPNAATGPAAAGDTVYVKNGSGPYTDNVAMTNSEQPTTCRYCPVNHGTSDTNRVIIKAAAGHAPTVARTYNTADDINSPVGGCNTSYCTWSGISPVLRSRGDIYLWATGGLGNITGSIIEYVVIDKAPTTRDAGNYDGIRVENSTDGQVRYNRISNVIYTGNAEHNAACIKLYPSIRTLVFNNTLSACNAGIYDKSGGNGNRHYKNFVYGMNSDSILVHEAATGTTQDIHIYQNVVHDGAYTGISISVPSTNTRFYVYNNTINDVSIPLMVSPSEVPGYTLYYNNIAVSNGVTVDVNYAQITATFPGISPVFTTPLGWASSYNTFFQTGGTIRFNPDGRDGVVGEETLTTWRLRIPAESFDSATESLPASSADTDGIDPQFLGGTITAATVSVTNFRVANGSPTRNAGRTGGTATGSVVNMGAYLSDADVIGYPTQGASPSSPGLRGAPLGWFSSQPEMRLLGYRALEIAA